MASTCLFLFRHGACAPASRNNIRFPESTRLSPSSRRIHCQGERFLQPPRRTLSISTPRSLASSALCEPLIPTPVCVIWGIRAQQQTLNLTWLGVYSFREQGLVQPEIHERAALSTRARWRGISTLTAFLLPSLGSEGADRFWEARARAERPHCSSSSPFSRPFRVSDIWDPISACSGRLSCRLKHNLF